MVELGPHIDSSGRSAFRVFAPTAGRVEIALLDPDRTVPLLRNGIGYWEGTTGRLPQGTRYLVGCDGRRLPDPASRCQPDGVHGPSMVVDLPRAASPGWRGVAIEDAILYELHLGTFTPEGTLAAAAERLPHLADLGVTVVELMPIAAFPGERNWGYDGTYPLALHAGYGGYPDLARFLETAHGLGLAVILDVVANHFGPEGNYSGALAPYTRAADTPWGAEVNFDGPWNHGVRHLFLGALRHWLRLGFDGFRMDAVSLIHDNSPVSILRACTDLARSVGAAEGREVLMIAEHLRNDRRVTADDGFAYGAQWNDDPCHALFAHLTGEAGRHLANFGAFEDVVKALRDGFVLDGGRFDRHYRCFLGTDGRATRGREHVVYLQNHDQVGNRARGDRMIATYGRDRALLAATAVLASPYLPMLFMGEEWGETAPFLFFEDFGDPALVEAVRRGRSRERAEGDAEPPAPHDRATFEASKLRWERRDSPEGQAVLRYYRALLSLKRQGALGPRDRSQVEVRADVPRRLLFLETPRTLTALNFGSVSWPLPFGEGWTLHLASVPGCEPGQLPGLCACVYLKA